MFNLDRRMCFHRSNKLSHKDEIEIKQKEMSKKKVEIRRSILAGPIIVCFNGFTVFMSLMQH